ncbi:hypothetical protein MJO28_003638 [Puccinia striiformis f. sp. tritici]|uniref:Uncharacterized protein n=2 Tax=Puccinia striiformis f. sp. tritici TaxID=168172 RepID=A0A0L0UXH1_9BASI|nr:hypothetical protein Pst134EA_007755 [Puccinia striiformis f. sp. tritici]KAH9470503.1 hypothetical protein Pst134EA_007755 [Puccinia striiformis f. sp. tritici]KAI7956543.1 hypothetical protein MJO28_003638 [Puccinia striiformis f. sp. tritici]KAI9610929.1 hypothetical protein H4Q26_008775 [Puccinia striiformis f. sp. tritici PST-130]KNE91725.1 hypothetical protein PSTG_14882 [Puccinia striiformis f. sp. tritici PST-78]
MCSLIPDRRKIVTPTLDGPNHHQRVNLWDGYGLDKQVIKNLDRISLIPEELHKRIIRCILQAHHLEIVVPLGSNTTNVVQAALISFVASSSTKLKKEEKEEIRSSGRVSSPMVLVLCINTEMVEQHCSVCQEIGKEVDGIDLDDHSTRYIECLSTDLEVARNNHQRAIWMTTLSRFSLLLQHQVIRLDRLSILVLDLREPSNQNSLNHHLVAELEPLLNSMIGNHVQLIILTNLEAPPLSTKLSDLITKKMESSIINNTLNLYHSSTTTPSLISGSNTTTPSSVPFWSPPTFNTPTIINNSNFYDPPVEKPSLITAQIGNSFNEQLQNYRTQSYRW